MAQPTNLRDFLNANKGDSAYTHLSLSGGKYFIKQEDMNLFYDLYMEAILDGETPHLVEKNTNPIGALRIDFDFIYDTDIKTHQHTKEQITSFLEAYMDEVSQRLKIPAKVEIFVMEKRRPTHDKERNRMKSGIHFVVPNVNTTKTVEESIRRSLLKKDMENYFKGLPLKEDWKKVYDEGVVKRTANWMLYKSRKPDSQPYEIKYVFEYDGKFTEKPIPEFTVGLIKRLSIRRNDEDETPLTENGIAISNAETEPRISGGRAVTPARGRPAQREKPSSRASSPNGRILRELDPAEKEYIKEHVMNLNEERYTDYQKWVEIGICLHNIHPDLVDVFLDFSSQSEKYNEVDCIQKWNTFTFRNDGDRTGLPSLRYWSRTDNFDGYKFIEDNNIGSLVRKAISCTEHDVAKVIHAKYRDHYKCTDFGKNVWFRWMGHIWTETDSGVDLQIKFSSDIADVFQKAANICGKEVEGRKCSTEGQDKCGQCDYCKSFSTQVGMLKVVSRLKTTGFKSNLMRECKELFFDEQFTKKVDSTKTLIAFNNGVMDLADFTFRAGKPEDYISFSTEIDYEEDKKYYEYQDWPKIDKFICQVIPDPEVRTYFMNHLATCLVGGNQTQKFHILTGSGSNGKSMLMNLTSKALGDYAAVVPIALFTQKRAGSGAAAPEVIRLKGRRFVTMQEPDEKVALNTGLMKLVSSGEKMYARDLFKSGCEFEVQAKFHLACNDKPEVNATDGGTWRRLVVINYTSKFVDKPSEPHHFPIDEAIQYAVTSNEWAKPFLNYLIHLLKNQTGKINPPAKVLEYTDDYRNDTDGVAKFISEKIEKSDGVEAVTKPQLHSVFKQWKIQNEQNTLTVKELHARIIEKYGKYPENGWTNFRLNFNN